MLLSQSIACDQFGTLCNFSYKDGHRAATITAVLLVLSNLSKIILLRRIAGVRLLIHSYVVLDLFISDIILLRIAVSSLS